MDQLDLATQQLYNDTKGELVSTTLNNETFVVPPRYQLEKILGRGAYGFVCSANDTSSNTRVAIKKNKAVFTTGSAPHVLIPKRVLRELKILAHLQHPNIISLKDVCLPKSFNTFNDIYMVTELMETDLRKIMRSGQKLSDRHIQFIIFQVLAALNYTHSASILHRDLKPENILINSDSRIKVCDFGLARGIDFDNDATMSTTYVQTRWYRAPELLLNYGTVSKQADMWSVGCIFAELLLGNVMFKGNSPVNQIERIVEIMGTPNLEDVRGSNQGIEFIKALGQVPGRPLEKVFSCVSNPLALDLLAKMLAFNPEKRISALEAVNHPYMADFYDESIVFECNRKFDFKCDDGLKDTLTIKMEAYDTILRCNGYVLSKSTGMTPRLNSGDMSGKVLSPRRSSFMNTFKSIFNRGTGGVTRDDN